MSRADARPRSRLLPPSRAIPSLAHRRRHRTPTLATYICCSRWLRATDILRIATTRETVYAELPCDRALPADVANRFGGTPVGFASPARRRRSSTLIRRQPAWSSLSAASGSNRDRYAAYGTPTPVACNGFWFVRDGVRARAAEAPVYELPGVLDIDVVVAIRLRLQGRRGGRSTRFRRMTGISSSSAPDRWRRRRSPCPSPSNRRTVMSGRCSPASVRPACRGRGHRCPRSRSSRPGCAA